MTETLGSLCDKLTIFKLKQYDSEDANKLASEGRQTSQLRQDQFVADAVGGVHRLSG